MPAKIQLRKGQRFENWEVVKEANGGLWEVKCTNCAQIRFYAAGLLRSRAKTKGKRLCNNCSMMPKGQAGFNCLLHEYKSRAAEKNVEFSLTDKQFRYLTQLSCFYCKSWPSLVRTGGNGRPNGNRSTWGDYTFNGVDRKDNDSGYVWGNCVPCCFVCNRAKGDMGYEDFLAYRQRIAEVYKMSKQAAATWPEQWRDEAALNMFAVVLDKPFNLR